MRDIGQVVFRIRGHANFNMDSTELTEQRSELEDATLLRFGAMGVKDRGAPPPRWGRVPQITSNNLG